MKVAHGQLCVAETGHQCSCRYPSEGPASKLVHAGDPDPPAVATLTVSLLAIPVAAALPIGQGVEARVPSPTTVAAGSSDAPAIGASGSDTGDTGGEGYDDALGTGASCR